MNKLRIIAMMVLILASCARLETDRGLNSAAFDGDLEKVKLLIENGADVNGKGWDGDTPLANAIREEHFEIVELLLTKGADTKNDFVKEALRKCKNQKIIELAERHY